MYCWYFSSKQLSFKEILAWGKNTFMINPRLPFPELFILLCVSTFGIIFVLPEEYPLIFLMVQVCLCWVVSAFIYSKVSLFHSHFMVIFTRYKILCWEFWFFQYIKGVVPLSFGIIASDEKSAITPISCWSFYVIFFFWVF